MKLLYEILLGYKSTTIDSIKFRLNSPSIEDLFEAEDVYEQELNESLDDGLFSEDQYLTYLFENDLWTLEEEELLKSIPKEIEDLKIALFENLGKSVTRKNLRNKLDSKREELKECFYKRNNHSYLTADGIAALGKTQFIVCRTIFPSVLSLDEYSPVFDKILSWRNKGRLSEKDLRKIARSDEWKSYWESGNPFDKPTTELTEDQRSLICVTKMYDNINESPECPSKEVLEDDDTLDGWILLQKRKKEKGYVEDQIQKHSGVKGDMVFLPVESVEDAKKIHDMNNPVSKAIIQQRNKILVQKGSVDELEFPDARLKMMNILKERR